MENSFFYNTRASKELPIVYPRGSISEEISSERGWRCLKVHRLLDFGQTGILLSLAKLLASAGISIFAISTHNMDYLLIKACDLSMAIEALRLAGYEANNENQFKMENILEIPSPLVVSYNRWLNRLKNLYKILTGG